MKHAVIVGAGPAGLMAADVLAAAGVRVTICDQKPSVARKFLMAGKSGLNLTKVAPPDEFQSAFAEAGKHLAPMLDAFGVDAVQTWAQGLGQETFVGSTGRVFPTAMKASPLLRAWLARLAAAGVQINTRWRWLGWNGDRLQFDTPDGVQELHPDVTILALGGASWARLGSDGAWAGIFGGKGVGLAPFAPANAGIAVDWSDRMQRHFGAALKSVHWHAGQFASRGEAAISARGLEGGGIYSVSRGLREGHPLIVDLLPDLRPDQAAQRVARRRGKASLSNHLRKTLGLTAAQIALVHEMAHPLPGEAGELVEILKALEIQHQGLRPMDEAISTAGGLPFAELDQHLMIKAMPGVFVAGEMLDWEAPTGGYLITACLATGRWAGQGAVKWVL